MIRPLLTGLLLWSLGCATVNASTTLTPITDTIESSLAVEYQDASGVKVVRAEEGMWFARHVYRPDSYGNLSLAGVEMLFCPSKGDVSRCRAGVIWASGQDPRGPVTR